MPAEKRSAYGVPLAIATLLAIDALIVWALGIQGEFPLGDDWAYAWPVRSLCERGEIDLLPWTGASVVAQVGYGAALCKAFGFSFEVLRASTLALGAAADVGVLLLALQLGAPAPLALLAALAFALSPLRVNLGFTFMSDVPFTAFVVWSAYFYARGLRRRRLALVLLASLLAAVAALIRQHGIFVAAAAALATLPVYATNRDDRPVTRLRTALACAALPVAALATYYGWLLFLHGAPEAVARKTGEALQIDPLAIGNLAFRAVEYLGMSLLPLAIVATTVALRSLPLRTIAMTAGLGAIAYFLYLREGALMPYLPNLVYDFGVGALTLRDTLFLGMPPPLTLGALFRVPLTVVATVTSAAVLACWSRTLLGVRRVEAAVVALALALLSAGSLLHTHYYFDRYLLPILALAAAATAGAIAEIGRQRQPPRPNGPIGMTAVLALALMGWFSVAGTHDYLAWNRARHALLDELVTGEGVTPTRIDGGMEFNAWHFAKASGYAPTDSEVKIGADPTAKSWWWVVDDEYVVSMRPLPGYELHSSRLYDTWLVPGRASMVMLRRSDSAPAAAPEAR
jgi:4-amino-4-deoxy-L-arabinose transferase-like glycosyltransferase